ncbi:MAG TPA: competence/damage-inducible protein A [Tepidisphaeraceae bacterium]|nr:competence/damage-inducible protein A [Tepidisphaeraceae bacterium]
MTGIILSIGDELVLGQTIDTNSAWLSQQLAAIGCIILRHLTIGDDQLQIESAIRESAQLSDIVLISGGIGPTEDDLTRQALASVMNEPLEPNAVWLTELEKFFAQRGRPMPPINRIQAMIPRGAAMIFNHAGTAAGMNATLKRSDGKLCDVYVMPGVPKEMKKMFQMSVRPELQARSGGAVILSRTLHTFGLGESAIAERLGPLMHRDRNPSVGTTVAAGVVSLRINARFDSMQRASDELARIENECRSALGDLIYGQDEQTLQDVVATRLFEINAKLPAGTDPYTVTTAESCTGGLLAKMLTDLSGSSAYFHRGFVTYSNEAKAALLGVDSQLIGHHGAVSEEVAKAMALGALSRAQAKAALAISGIAGPTGGTPTKPVGTVCIAIATLDDRRFIPSPGTPGEGQGGGSPSTREESSSTPSPALPRNTGGGREARAVPHAHARTFLFPGDREMIRDRSAKMALTMLRFHLLGKRMPF